MDDSRVDTLARTILTATRDVSPIDRIARDDAPFDLADAYAVSRRIAEIRRGEGERIVGWKIGFTNRAIWDEYDVHAPIWGPMYDRTVFEVDPDSPAFVPVDAFSEPRIEPEIAFRLKRTPHPAMDTAELLGCVDGVAHGFEVVQSVFAGWKFAAADTIAACALHGRYLCGPFAPVDDERTWLARLDDFVVRLYRDGEEVDEGHAHTVLGGPLHALSHFVRGLADTPFPPGLKPGHVVTTGTVTRAFPVSAGETWRSEIAGLPLPGLTLTIDR